MRRWRRGREGRNSRQPCHMARRKRRITWRGRRASPPRSSSSMPGASLGRHGRATISRLQRRARRRAPERQSALDAVYDLHTPAMLQMSTPRRRAHITSLSAYLVQCDRWMPRTAQQYPCCPCVVGSLCPDDVLECRHARRGTACSVRSRDVFLATQVARSCVKRRSRAVDLRRRRSWCACSM